MEESTLIDGFIKQIETYPFKTVVHKEVSCEVGRVDIRLPDYDIAIEAKGSDGNVKHAIGQAVSYGVALDDHAYVLLPPDLITNTVVDIAEHVNVGIVTSLPDMTNFSVAVDVGGFNPFYPSTYDNISHSKWIEPSPWKEQIV